MKVRVKDLFAIIGGDWDENEWLVSQDSTGIHREKYWTHEYILLHVPTGNTYRVIVGSTGSYFTEIHSTIDGYDPDSEQYIKLTEVWPTIHTSIRYVNRKPNNIVLNAAKCLLCKDYLESQGLHDTYTCTCGNVTISGGYNKIVRDVKNDVYHVELSVGINMSPTFVPSTERSMFCVIDVESKVLVGQPASRKTCVNRVKKLGDSDRYRIVEYVLVPKDVHKLEE